MFRFPFRFHAIVINYLVYYGSVTILLVCFCDKFTRVGHQTRRSRLNAAGTTAVRQTPKHDDSAVKSAVAPVHWWVLVATRYYLRPKKY